jgi:hypothetical protein
MAVKLPPPKQSVGLTLWQHVIGETRTSILIISASDCWQNIEARLSIFYSDMI